MIGAADHEALRFITRVFAFLPCLIQTLFPYETHRKPGRAVFHGTQEFLGKTQTIAKTKMIYRFGAQWFEAPETFVTTGKCEKEIIGPREQPILWEQLQQLRRANENRSMNTP